MYSNVSAVILAGGRSSRMGQDKAALRLGGRTLLQHTVSVLRRLGIAEILVAGRTDCPEGTAAVPDICPHRGPLSGIHGGLLAITNPCALILPVDMPLISEKTLELLISAHGEKPITVFAGTPLPGVFNAELSALCAQLLQADNHSLRKLLDTAGALRIQCRAQQELMNCNTPEDFALIRRILSEKMANEPGKTL